MEDYGFVRFSNGDVEHESSAASHPLAEYEWPVPVSGDAATPDEARRPLPKGTGD